MKNRLGIAIGSILTVLVLIQLVPVNRDNPSLSVTLPVSAEVGGALRRSCFDCHSNETRWPWYSYVAPVSWFISHHVTDGREHLNLSKFDGLSADAKEQLAREIAEVLEEGGMPPRSYAVAHSEAKLSESERKALLEWANSMRSRPQEETRAPASGSPASEP